MRKEVIFLAVAASCMLAACAKEIKEQEAVSPVSESVPEEETVVTPPVHREGWTYIGAENGEVTKASIGNSGGTAVFSWNTGDRIAVFSGDTYHVSAPMDASYDGTNAAEFAFEGSIDAGRTDFAVYPASLIDDCDNPTESSIEVKLPSSYNINQVKDDAVPIPMIAVNAPGNGLSFKRICGLLRISLTNVPKQTESISLSFSGRKVNGTFTLSDVDLTDLESFKGVISVPATEAADSVITITGISLNALTKDYVINVPVPVGVTSDAEYKEVTVTTRDHEGHKINSFRAPIKSSGVWVPKRTTNRKLAVTLPVFTAQGTTAFNDGVKVVFAPGNLRATLAKVPVSSKPGYASKWEFANHHYDAIAAATDGRTYPINSFKNSEVNDVIDLFSWCGSDATGFSGSYAPEEDPDRYKYGIIHPSGSGIYVGSGSSVTIIKDWGNLTISDNEDGSYPPGTWRLPGRYTANEKLVAEWNTLVNGRSLAFQDAKATLKNNAKTEIIAKGLILFPDSYSHPSTLPSITNKASGHGSKAHYTDNTLTLDQWERMEAMGCVFLPVTNYRDSSRELPYTADAAYWADYALNSANAGGMSMSDIDDCATTINKGATAITTNKYIGKNGGAAVRLIRDVN